MSKINKKETKIEKGNLIGPFTGDVYVIDYEDGVLMNMKEIEANFE